MDDWSPQPQQEVGASSGPARRQRGSRAARAAVATAVAGGLAAGSYGIISAASASGAARQPSGQILSAASNPAKSPVPSSGHLWSGGPHGLGWSEAGGAFGTGGSITAVSPTTITVKSLFGRTMTVTTNSSTTYREGGSKVARAALVVGEQVAFRAPQSAASSSKGSPLVVDVEIIQPQAFGKVVKVSGSQLVVSGRGGLDIAVNLSSSTAYEDVGHSASRSDVRVGSVVLATGGLSSAHNQIDATTVQIIPASVAGRVTKIVGPTITIRGFDGTTETVTTDSGTIFRNVKGKTTLASVAKGDFVEAFGTAGAKSFGALTVFVGPVSPVGMPGGGFGGPDIFGGRRFGGPGFGGPGGFGRRGRSGWHGTFPGKDGLNGSPPPPSGQPGGGSTTA